MISVDDCVHLRSRRTGRPALVAQRWASHHRDVRIGVFVMAMLMLVACSSAPGTVAQQPLGWCAGAPEASTGCTPGVAAAPGGLVQAAAVAAARGAVNGGPDATVVWAAVASSPYVLPGPGPLVWMVRLAGPLASPPCPADWLAHVATPSDPACLDQDGGIIVVLDYYSGAVLGWDH